MNTTNVIQIEKTVKQNFQSDYQLMALKVHDQLMVAWRFVTTPFRWVIEAIDSTPTIKE